MQDTWVRSLGWEDPLEKEMAAHSSILAWKIPWTVDIHGVAKSRTRLSSFTNIALRGDTTFCLTNSLLLDTAVISSFS